MLNHSLNHSLDRDRIGVHAPAPRLPRPAPGLGLADECQRQRILIVEENELIQAGLRAVLDEAAWVAQCLVARGDEEAMTIARRCQPQLILVSTSLPDGSGPSLCRAITAAIPYAKVVLLSGDGRVPAALASSLGAVAALSKQMSSGALVGTLKHIADGARVFPKVVVSRPARQLSQRETDVLQHVASGLSNREVAEQLNLSRHTVKQHTSAVYRKLGVRNRAEAAGRALELGLLAWHGLPADARQAVG